MLFFIHSNKEGKPVCVSTSEFKIYENIAENTMQVTIDSEKYYFCSNPTLLPQLLCKGTLDVYPSPVLAESNEFQKSCGWYTRDGFDFIISSLNGEQFESLRNLLPHLFFTQFMEARASVTEFERFCNSFSMEVTFNILSSCLGDKFTNILADYGRRVEVRKQFN